MPHRVLLLVSRVAGKTARSARIMLPAAPKVARIAAKEAAVKIVVAKVAENASTADEAGKAWIGTLIANVVEAINSPFRRCPLTIGLGFIRIS